jgi:hypothetical protein
MNIRLYMAWGALVLSLFSAAQYRGWSFLPVNQVKNVPKSIRDNPGAYRSIYQGSYHYFGGK